MWPLESECGYFATMFRQPIQTRSRSISVSWQVPIASTLTVRFIGCAGTRNILGGNVHNMRAFGCLFSKG